MSPELLSRIAHLRQRAINNELTEAEMAEAIRLLREDRKGASIAVAKARTARTKVEVSAADLLGEMMGD